MDTNGHSAVDRKRRHGDPGADSSSELIAPPKLAGTRLHAGSGPPTRMLNIDTPRPSKHRRLALPTADGMMATPIGTKRRAMAVSAPGPAAGQALMSSTSATIHAPHSDVQRAPVAPPLFQFVFAPARAIEACAVDGEALLESLRAPTTVTARTTVGGVELAHANVSGAALAVVAANAVEPSR